MRGESSQPPPLGNTILSGRDVSAVYRAPDGATFSLEHWGASSPERALLFCLHGMGSSAEGFEPLAAHLAPLGVTTIAPNVRGQGLDPEPRRRGAALDYPAIRSDLSALVAAARAGRGELPWFLCGESMGALLAARLLADPAFLPKPAGGVFFVPVVSLAKPTPAWQRLLLEAAALVFPGARLHPGLFVHGKARSPQLTRDGEYQRRLEAAPHRIDRFALRFLSQMGALMDASDRYADRMETPVLLLTAGHDAFVKPEVLGAWFDRIAAADKTLRHYPESYHLLLHDDDRAEVLADITRWLLPRCGGAVGD